MIYKNSPSVSRVTAKSEHVFYYPSEEWLGPCFLLPKQEQVLEAKNTQTQIIIIELDSLN